MNKKQVVEIRDEFGWKEFVGTVVAVALIAALLFAVSGCGHNSVVYGDGIGVETTFNPETYAVGVQFRYGKILTAAVKEKTKISLSGGAKQDTSTGSTDSKALVSSTSTDATLTIETGDQVTGYVVELEKVKSGKTASTSTATDSAKAE